MRVILSLGTNTDFGNIAIAEEILNGIFSAVRVSKTLISPAVDNKGAKRDYANAIMEGETMLAYDEVCATIRLVEHTMGRDRNDTENVSMDVDLLLYDTHLFKPSDWHRPYNQQLLSEMGL